MIPMGETTTIPVTKGTRDRLKTIGQKGETYDEIIHRFIEIAEQMDFVSKQKRILGEEEFVPLDQV
jgi:hypothetical protein